MADISKVKIPSVSTPYNIKDANAGYSVEIVDDYLNLKNSAGTIISNAQLPSASSSLYHLEPINSNQYNVTGNNLFDTNANEYHLYIPESYNIVNNTTNKSVGILYSLKSMLATFAHFIKFGDVIASGACKNTQIWINSISTSSYMMTSSIKGKSLSGYIDKAYSFPDTQYSALPLNRSAVVSMFNGPYYFGMPVTGGTNATRATVINGASVSTVANTNIIATYKGMIYGTMLYQTNYSEQPYINYLQRVGYPNWSSGSIGSLEFMLQGLNNNPNSITVTGYRVSNYTNFNEVSINIPAANVSLSGNTVSISGAEYSYDSYGDSNCYPIRLVITTDSGEVINTPYLVSNYKIYT